jgi:hypothetical protein
MKLNKLTHDQLASLGQSLLDMSYDEQDDSIQLEQKAIGSRKWTKKDPEAPFDLLNYEYRSTGLQRTYEGPRLQLKGSEVRIYDTNEANESDAFIASRPLTQVRALFRMMQSARKNQERKNIYMGDDASIDEIYDISINYDGDITVGCQFFTFEEVQKFLKSID